MNTTKRSAIYGPEAWLTTSGADWCHWDLWLWLCVVACIDHDGDLTRLADAIAHAHRAWGGRDAERKLSHLDDLAERLHGADQDASALAAYAGDRPALRSKARAKVLKQGLYERDLTDPMRCTPRERLYERALHGGWDRYPVPPQAPYDRLVRALGEPWLPKGHVALRASHRDSAQVDRSCRRRGTAAGGEAGAGGLHVRDDGALR